MNNCSFWYTFAGVDLAWAILDFRFHAWGWMAFSLATFLLLFYIGHSEENKALDAERAEGKIDGILESAASLTRRSYGKWTNPGDGTTQH